MLDIEKIRQDFPILKTTVKGKRLAYLDNASTTQKPQIVIDTLKDYYESYNANVHRGIYDLSEKSSAEYEETRTVTQKFINAEHEQEIIFTRNTTESINLVAYTWGERNIQAGDEIIVSILEHHANFVPWQQLAKRKNAKFNVIPLTKDDLSLDMEAYKSMLTDKTKIVAITGMSNATGCKPDIDTITKLAHEKGALVLLDAAQTAAHQKIDVQALDCDFLAFSSHKMLGPTGIGVLYGKKELLNSMPPFLFGGDMIKTVKIESTLFNDVPFKFEAGTPNIADTIGFKAAIRYLEQVGLENIHKHEQELTAYAIEKFSAHPEVTLYHPKDPTHCGPVVSFTIENIHPHDISSLFNEEGVAIRSGQHCTEPLPTALNIPATARMSFYLYNTKEDVDQAEQALINTINLFK